MSKQRIRFELNQACKALGYTMRANINPDLIRELKRWNMDSAKIINRALKEEDCKTAIREMRHAASRNEKIRSLSARHDKFIYDKDGDSIMIYYCDSDKVYTLE